MSLTMKFQWCLKMRIILISNLSHLWLRVCFHPQPYLQFLHLWPHLETITLILMNGSPSPSSSLPWFDSHPAKWSTPALSRTKKWKCSPRPRRSSRVDGGR
uniref:Uncharacterized protein n=1 Tax=Cacopsylla melanoneura TaxID=428564 RepID=A0A8D9DT10_9HEMI